jgi:DNA polymerase V
MPTINIPSGPLPAAFIPARLEPAPLFRPLSICSMPAGFPSPADDYLDNSLDLHEHLVRNRTATFYFRVKGDSMQGEKIFDGDLLVVDRSITPKHGHVVVATVDGDFTVKKFFRRLGVIELRPANPAFEPIKFDDGQELVVWGVVTSAIHQLKA